ncbi:Uncharacterized protein Fot_55464 [Forsythia ovata]|uniref:Cytochrome P450 n=1 Tax=Forsythia ovata TaxID=205694 RepID=A0ABD1P4V2_9LAMI
MMAKATQELDTVIVREKKVKESEIPNLPYLDAIVKETMRLHLHPVAVLLAPHFSLQYCIITGFHIRKGTKLTWGALRGKEQCEENQKSFVQRGFWRWKWMLKGRILSCCRSGQVRECVLVIV